MADPAVSERARWWSWRRQRLDRSCRGVEDCLRSVVAVSGANPHGPLSLLARVPRLLKGAAVEGVIDTRRALRVPAMRRSLFVLPRETAHLAMGAALRPEPAYRWLLGRNGIDDAELERLKGEILGVAQTPKQASEIKDAIRTPPANLTPVLQALCAYGDLIRTKATSIRSNEFSYCSMEAWLGEPLRTVDRAEALVWLAGDYLTAFGPARAEDFAWWTGMPVAAAAEALAGHDPVDVGGGMVMHQRDERAFLGMRPFGGRVSLLPKWDCYTMGYAPDGRSRFAASELLPLIYDAGGNAQPVVLVEGAVEGLWETRITGARIKVTLSMFDEPGPRLRADLDAEAELIGGFLEAQRVVIEHARIERPRPRLSAKRKPVARKPAAAVKRVPATKAKAKAQPKARKPKPR